MSNGWSHDFDLKDVPDGVMKAIRENLKKWDDAAREWREEATKRQREEVEKLKAEHEKLVGYDQLQKVPEPKFCKCTFCPCMNGGDGGLIIND